jgi:NitT/TauT family transport system permease protein
VRSMGARTLKIMLRVRGPTALPQMFAGFKIAICLSVVGAIVGEFVGSDKGLGYLLLTATGTLDGTLVWSALFILIAIGIVLFAIVSKFERLAIPWHVSMRAEETAVYQS